MRRCAYAYGHTDNHDGTGSISTHRTGFRDLPFTLETLIDAIQKTVAANGFGDCYIRRWFIWTAP